MGDIILYQDILNTYNIDQVYSFKDLNYNLSEKVLMKMIFSKFITDRQYNTDTSKYISFILRSSALTTVNIDDIKLNTHYYRQNMIKTDKRSSEESTPSLNAKIVDFDMTHFASNDIINYCFYIDIIIEIYNAVHEIKVNKRSLIFDELMIKSRYYYDDNFPILFSESSVGHFDINIKLTRDEQTKVLKDIEFVSEKPTNKILNIFKVDIMKHLEYINKEDITFANPSYVTDVINFYKLCRLKLMYSVVHSMYLSTLKDSDNSNNDLKDRMMDFIREYVLSVFINFKTLSSFDSSTDDNDEVYSSEVISKANKLRKVNESIRRRKDKLKTKNAMNKNTKDAMKKQSYINIAARVMIILVSLISLVLMFSDVDNKSKSILSMITIAIAIIGYVILMLISKSINSSTNFEKFENSSNMVSLPQVPLTKNNMIYHDNTYLYFFRVKASSSLGEDNDAVNTNHPYFAFDGKLSTSWKSDNASTYVNGKANYTNVHSTLKGEFIMIDLCQYVDVQSITISFTDAKCGPKSFTLLQSKEDSLWNDNFIEGYIKGYSYFISKTNYTSSQKVQSQQDIGEGNKDIPFGDIEIISSKRLYDYYFTNTKEVDVGDKKIKIIDDWNGTYLLLNSDAITGNIDGISQNTNGYKYSHQMYITIFKYNAKNAYLQQKNASYDNTMTKTFDIPQSNFTLKCRYFLLVIHELTGDGDHAEISSLKFNLGSKVEKYSYNIKNYVLNNNSVDIPSDVMNNKIDFILIGAPGQTPNTSSIFEIKGNHAYDSKIGDVRKPRRCHTQKWDNCGWIGVSDSSGYKRVRRCNPISKTTCYPSYIAKEKVINKELFFGNASLTVGVDNKELISQKFVQNMNYGAMLAYKKIYYDSINIDTVTSLPDLATYSKIVPVVFKLSLYDLSKANVTIKFDINATNLTYKAALVVYSIYGYNPNAVDFEDIKKIIEAEILTNNVTPIDSAEYLANILKQEQKRLADIQKKIDDLNKSFTTESGNLQDQIDERRKEIAEGDEGYTMQLLESQKALQEATVEEAKKKSDLANAEAATAAQKNLADAEDAFIVSAQKRREDLQKSRREYMDAFQKFMTASQKAEYAAARLEDSTAAYDIALIAANKAEADAQKQLELENTGYMKLSAENAAQKAKLEEDTARKNAELKETNYRNKLRDDQIATLQSSSEIDSGLLKKYQQEHDLALLALDAAKENRTETENEAAIYLQQLNANYDMNTKNLEEANYEMKIKKAKEEEIRNQIEVETTAIKVEEEKQNSITANSEIITTVINNQIQDIDDNIEELEDLIQVQMTRISTLQSEKESLEIQFQDLLVSTGNAASIEEANRRNAQKRIKVNELKTEKASLLAELLQRDMEFQESEKQKRVELTKKENLINALQDQMDITDQHRSDIAYNKKLLEDYNVYDITKDIDAQILQSLNRNVNSINNELVLGKLNKEYDQFDRYQKAMKLYVHHADSDTEITSLEKKSIDDGTHYILHLSIIIAIVVFVFNQTRDVLTTLIAGMILFIIATSIYYINMFRRVRTRSRNYYWDKIKNKNANNLTL